MIDLKSFPQRAFAHAPTPLEEMQRLREELGPDCPRLFVKRDDCTGLATGGNKTRKLEFLVGQALAKGAGALVTVGALQSNHARQTAAAAAAAGLQCTLVLFRAVDSQDPAYDACGNILLDRLLGAEIHLVDPSETETTVAGVMAEYAAKGVDGYLVPYGGSSTIGALGYVKGCLEILEDFRERDVMPAALFHASSSGATQAGLTVATAALDVQWAVCGVNVLKPMVDDLHSAVSELVSQTATTLATDPREARRRIEIVDGYLGDGYGLPTDQMVEALQLAARTEGILLDPVYTGKAMAALIGEVRSGRFSRDESIVFLHTGGAAALHAYPGLFGGRPSEQPWSADRP